MKKIILISLWLALIAFGASASILKEDQTVSVTGTGVVQVAPDTATVRLGVEVVKKTAQESQAENAGAMQKILAAIAKLDIPKEKIQTSGFYIWPETKYEPNQPPRIVGYRCNNQVRVTIEDLSKISKVIDAGISAGANNVQGIQFSIKDDSESKKSALDKAVKDASAKAQAIANAAGIKIKSVKNIIESGAAVPINLEFSGARAMGAGGAETPVSPGLMEVRGNVTVVYRAE